MMGVKAIILFGVMFVAGVSAVANALWGPRARARKRLDSGTKTTIADREIVTLTGVVRAVGEPLTAPLSGKACVLYQATGRMYGEANEVAAQADEQKMRAFELETAEGVVRVEGEAADVELPPLPIIPRRLERERDFLVAHGWSAANAAGAGFEEVRVEPGMKVRVQGMAIVELDPSAPEGAYRDGSRRIKLVAHEQHPLTIGRAR